MTIDDVSYKRRIANISRSAFFTAKRSKESAVIIKSLEDDILRHRQAINNLADAILDLQVMILARDKMFTEAMAQMSLKIVCLEQGTAT